MASPRLRTAERSDASSAAVASTRRAQETPVDEEAGRVNSSDSTEKDGQNFATFNETTALLADLDRHEERFYRLGPVESIYSFFLFMPCVEYRQTGKRCNYILGFALGLVFLNILMQCCLMYAVSADAVHQQSDVMQHLMVPQPPWYQFHKHFETAASKSCVPEALCHELDGQISCAPRTVALLDRWDLLDLDGDGIWSKREAENQTHRAALKCSFGSDPLLLYRQMVINVQAQPALSTRLHPNLVAGTDLHKPYFDWYMGEPLLCLHIDEDSCGNLFQRGVFDEAIKHGVQFKPEITDLQSARRYCTNLLRHRCQHILPSTYHVWRTEAQSMCGAKDFVPITYESPDQDPNNFMHMVQYPIVAEYGKYKSWVFLGYLGALLLTFFITMLAEWKDIYRTLLYCIQFPSVRGGANDNVQRSAVFVVTLLRIALWFGLLYGGTLFLTSNTDYLCMIFDALCLAFIITVDELIYATMLRPPMKSAHQELDALMLHRRKLCVSVHCLEVFMLLVVAGGAAAIAFSFQWQELKPAHEALQCLCSSEGSRCREAAVHGKDWWDTYWANLAVASARIDHL